MQLLELLHFTPLISSPSLVETTIRVLALQESQKGSCGWTYVVFIKTKTKGTEFLHLSFLQSQSWQERS
jgi:hypothetical protein